MIRWAFVVVFALLGVCFGSTSHAQVEEDDAARALFRLGEASYAQGRFDEALRHFQQAYDLSHRAQLLFNIGQASDRLGDRRRALEAFEAYQREIPNAPNRGFVRSRVEVLRGEIEAEDAAANAGGATERTSSDASGASETDEDAGNASTGRRTVGWSIVGAGGASLVVGAVFLALGRNDYDAVANASDGTTWAAIEAEHDRAARRVGVGATLLGVGVAAASIGLVLVLRSDEDDERAALDVQVTGNGVMLRGAF